MLHYIMYVTALKQFFSINSLLPNPAYVHDKKLQRAAINAITRGCLHAYDGGSRENA